MSLENYLVKSDVSATEIRCTFHREEVERLHKTLKEKGYDEYLSFVRLNLKDILKYISLSPSQREQKKWINHPDGLLLRFAALQISETVLQFQLDICDIVLTVDKGSYRKFHSVIANALAPLLFVQPLTEFPFEGYDSPFPDCIAFGRQQHHA